MNNFKKGDVVICIDDDFEDDLTLNKEYKVLNTSCDDIQILDDDEDVFNYDYTLFKLKNIEIKNWKVELE